MGHTHTQFVDPPILHPHSTSFFKAASSFSAGSEWVAHPSNPIERLASRSYPPLPPQLQQNKRGVFCLVRNSPPVAFPGYVHTGCRDICRDISSSHQLGQPIWHNTLRHFSSFLISRRPTPEKESAREDRWFWDLWANHREREKKKRIEVVDNPCLETITLLIASPIGEWQCYDSQRGIEAMLLPRSYLPVTVISELILWVQPTLLP